MSQLFDQVAGKRIIIFRFKFQSQLFVQVIDQDTPVKQIFILTDRLNVWDDLLIFLVDIAHDLLDQVLDRHDTGESAILVHQDRHMMPCLLHAAEQLVRILCLRHKKRLVEHPSDIAFFQRIFPKFDHHVLHMEHTDDIINAFLIYRYPAVPCLKDLIDLRLKRIFNVNGKHITPWHHDLLRRPLIELKHRVDHLTLVVIKCTALIPHFEECFDLFLRHSLLLVFGLHMKDLQNQLCRE